MLLDSDILIDLLRGKKEARDFLFSLPAHSLHCCSAITVAEIHSGMREPERQITTELIDSLVVLPVTRQVAEIAGKFRREYKSATVPTASRHPAAEAPPPAAPEKPKGSELELDDCLIAATAFVEGLELATTNRRHYPMAEVRVISVIW